MSSTTGSARPSGRSGEPSARPSAKGAKAGGGKAGGNRPAGKAGGKKGATRMRTPAPVKSGPPWGVIGIGLAVLLFGVIVIGYALYQIRDSKKPAAERIKGVVNYRTSGPKLLRNHVGTQVKYAQSPPVGGNHNPIWQDCMGDVYAAQIANEHAVHSLEHGTVWITYNPSLAKSQVAALASKVRGKPYLMMSPYPGEKSPISLQAWGYQLKVDKPSDKQIDEFISAYSQKASVEPGATCSGGVTKTGTDLKKSAG